jgi:hypothetical protein
LCLNFIEKQFSFYDSEVSKLSMSGNSYWSKIPDLTLSNWIFWKNVWIKLSFLYFRLSWNWLKQLIYQNYEGALDLGIREKVYIFWETNFLRLSFRYKKQISLPYTFLLNIKQIAMCSFFFNFYPEKNLILYFSAFCYIIITLHSKIVDATIKVFVWK